MIRRPWIVAISGVKNSGKTTLIEKLLPLLTERGMKVAVIKHDGHDFIPDVPGTDSARAKAAGACGTAVFSSLRYCVVKDQEDPSPEQLMKYFPEADMILLEGFKNSSWPKVEIVRRGNSEAVVCPKEGLLAVISDLEPERPEGVPLFGLEETEALAEYLLQCREQSPAERSGLRGRASVKIMVGDEDFFFGPGVLHLLQKIQEAGSIRSAAAESGLSYSKACKMLRRAEEGTGIRFLDRTIGGKNGGQSRLTEDGVEYMRRYEELLRRSRQTVNELYRDIFSGQMPSKTGEKERGDSI